MTHIKFDHVVMFDLVQALEHWRLLGNFDGNVAHLFEDP